jgi:hypothetical protein
MPYFRRDDWHPTSIRKAEDSPVFAHLSRAQLEKGWGYSEPMCFSNGKPLSERQSIIIASARIASLQRAYGAFVRCPFDEPAELDMWNIIYAVMVRDDETPYPVRIR